MKKLTKIKIQINDDASFTLDQTCELAIWIEQNDHSVIKCTLITRKFSKREFEAKVEID